MTTVLEGYINPHFLYNTLEVIRKMALEKNTPESAHAVWNADEAFAGDAVLGEIEAKFDVDFEPVNMSWNDHYQKVKRWAATGSLPR